MKPNVQPSSSRRLPAQKQSKNSVKPATSSKIQHKDSPPHSPPKVPRIQIHDSPTPTPNSNPVEDIQTNGKLNTENKIEETREADVAIAEKNDVPGPRRMPKARKRTATVGDSYSLTLPASPNRAELSSPIANAESDGVLQVKTDHDSQNGVKNDALLFDPSCDPENPVAVTFSDVSEALFKIRSGIEKTPCKRSPALSELTGMEIYLKNEFTLATGSFKERGARNVLLKLPKEQRKIGVIAASAGNHALALAYHGHLLNIPVTVVMPTVAPLMKISSCRKYGANVVIFGRHIGDAKDEALRIGNNKGLYYVNGYDHPHIIAGQGTCGMEILEDVPDMDAIIVPIGGAGLIAGIALALKTLASQVQVIGVETNTVPSFSAALKAGHPVAVLPGSTIADGLAVPTVGVNAFKTCRNLIDKVVTVHEHSVALSILRLVELEKAIVEGGGATGLAALLEGLLPELKGKKVVLPLCGGNIDTTVLGRCLERGLAVDGRLRCFIVLVTDRPGGIADLTALLARLGASIKDIYHERAWLKTDIFAVRVRVTLETHGNEHSEQIEAELRKIYKEVSVQ